MQKIARTTERLTDLLKQSKVPLYRSGLFIIRVLITSAGVPNEAATNPEQILENKEDYFAKSPCTRQLGVNRA